MSLLIKALKQAERVNRGLPAVSEIDDDSLNPDETEASLSDADINLESPAFDTPVDPVALEPTMLPDQATEPIPSRDPRPMSLEAIQPEIATDAQPPLPRHETTAAPDPDPATSQNSVRSVGESVDPANSIPAAQQMRSAAIVTTKQGSRPLVWLALASVAIGFGVWYFLFAKVADLSIPEAPQGPSTFPLDQSTPLASIESGSSVSGDESGNSPSSQGKNASSKPEETANDVAKNRPAREGTTSASTSAPRSQSVKSNPRPVAASRSKPKQSALAPALPAVRFNRTQTVGPSKRQLLSSAYNALVSGENQAAEKAYRKVLELDRNSSDAWIGLAAIAARRGDTTGAEQNYRAALRINPNDTVARAGLTSLTGDTNLIAQESQFRNLAADKNSGAAVQFALGNTLAAQGRWNEAQRAYFDASSADPAHPDYAFNLAIALERIRQPVAAVSHYQRAIKAATTRPAQFNPALAKERIRAIEQRARSTPEKVQSSSAGSLSP